MKAFLISILLLVILLIVFFHFLPKWKEDIKEAQEKAKIEQARKDSIANLAALQKQQETAEFPESGEGIIPEVGLKVTLKPMKSHTRPTGKVRYTFIDDPSIWIIEEGPRNDNSGIDEKKWWNMPAGHYLVTSEESRNVFFKWW